MSLPLLITPGDPAGIGPEVAVKAARRMGVDAVLVGDGGAIEAVAGPLPRITEVEAVAGLAVLEPPDTGEPVEVSALRVATRACLEGRGRAMVTGPIHKARLAAAGFPHPGHTDFLGELCGVDCPVMAFVGGSLRVALVTVHVPLARVSACLTRERVRHTLLVVHDELRRRLGIDTPRLLVCGLNPHAGDGGLLGTEEAEIIAPACQEARSLGIEVQGPISAEAAFRWVLDDRADIVIAMYHDQGLAPLKLVDFGRSVNWTMGLPIVRTSVDHGTADDIAGQGIADSSSMEAAIRLARRLTEPHSTRQSPKA
ncbi:MAG: 4-hydroxythreonine-4-phosphate dehydrogenase PdxA [Alphaproteobacteria bacterium]|nr:4-hydroxythreonine-4-phosphate dehydrogenase PdxA [Alphaproteobacteria bacterium]